VRLAQKRKGRSGAAPNIEKHATEQSRSESVLRGSSKAPHFRVCGPARLQSGVMAKFKPVKGKGGLKRKQQRALSAVPCLLVVLGAMAFAGFLFYGMFASR